MANYAASDVTYTVKNLRKKGDSRNHNRFQITFGDGVLTYATGGVPLTKGKLGCPNVIESMAVVAQASSGYQFSYIDSSGNLLVMQAPAQTHSHTLTLKNAAVSDGATTRVNAGSNLLGANTGGDLTIAGNGANGGIANATLAAASLTEPNGVALAAQTLIVEVIGW